MTLTKDDVIKHFNKLKSEKCVDYPVLTQFKLRFYKAKSYVGLCNYRRKDITVSTYYLDKMTLDELLDTLNHEMAHAVAGPQAEHGPVWQKIAKEFGAKPTKYARLSFFDPKSTDETLDPAKKYVIKFCGECVGFSSTMRDTKHMYLKHRKSTTYGKLVCELNPNYVGE